MTELYQSLSHSKWDCKYHVVPCCIRCIRAQTAAESHLRSDTPTSGTDFPWAGAAKGMPDSRRASDAGPSLRRRNSPGTWVQVVEKNLSNRGFCRQRCSRRTVRCSSSHPLRGGCLTCAEHVRQFEGASPFYPT